MGQNRRKAATGAALALLLTLGGGGVAMAWFTSGGTGSGSAAIGSAGASDFHIVGHSPSANLYPGGDPADFTFDVTNDGSGTEHLGTVAITVASDSGTGEIVDDGTPVAGCLASWFVVTPDVVVDTSITAGATDSAVSGASISMTESGGDQSACQGHTVDLDFVASLA